MVDFIKTLSEKAGEKSLEYYGKLKEGDVSGKATEKDLVSIADKAVEDFIITEIRKNFPDHGIFGEETGRSDSDSPYCWVIDPIDGTQNFVKTHPFYSISIALFYEGAPIAGAICAPVLKKLFYAEKGKGAFESGKKLSVSKCTSLGTASCATGFAEFRQNRINPTLQRFCQVSPKLRDIKRCGSAAVDLAFVAAGIYDGFWEEGLGLYDVGAGMLLVTEAGGIVCDFNKQNNIPQDGIVAAAPGIAEELLQALQI